MQRARARTGNKSSPFAQSYLHSWSLITECSFRGHNAPEVTSQHPVTASGDPPSRFTLGLTEQSLPVSSILRCLQMLLGDFPAQDIQAVHETCCNPQLRSPPACPTQLQHKHKHGQASVWYWHLTEILCSVSITCVYLDCKIFSRENTMGGTPGNQDKPFLPTLALIPVPCLLQHSSQLALVTGWQSLQVWGFLKSI